MAKANDELILGFVPSRSVHNIQVSATKIADHLSNEIGIPVKSITLSNYAAVVVGMKAKRIDIAFVGPLNYLILHNKTGAYPITAAVRKGKLGYKGLIITNNNSGVNSLKDLKGKNFAFGDALSASSNLYPKLLLKNEGIDSENDLRSILVSSQSAIVLAVMQG
ncbi:MAG: phosphate/phosphite/phosphonate ABC transporter substrate-binding protein, partial [Alphaproteobacteria bacterium]|nr:phosphate/phosphite/phosphonate ABC transporter substrate-binding protein [Alphaproteobacteria bacterium]